MPVLALSNSPLFINQERSHYLYQDDAHQVLLERKPNLATPLSKLIFNIKPLPPHQTVAAPWSAWLSAAAAADPYARLAQLLAHLKAQGSWQPERSYCSLLVRPNYDVARLSALFAPYYPVTVAFTYRSAPCEVTAAANLGLHLSYVRPEEQAQLESALTAQLPNPIRFQLPTSQVLAQQIEHKMVLALRTKAGELAGAVNFELNGLNLYIAHLFKFPGTSERNVLAKLVALSHLECAQRQLKTVYLYHLKDNPKVSLLYEQAGLKANPKFEVVYFLPSQDY